MLNLLVTTAAVIIAILAVIGLIALITVIVWTGQDRKTAGRKEGENRWK